MNSLIARLLALITLLAPLSSKAQTPPNDPGGRIIVGISPQCVAGTVVKIIDPATNTVVATLTPSGTTGLFDTGCTLPCPSKYIVRPENPNCSFTPAQRTVSVRCCPKVTKVKFTCNCSGQGGRIVVSVPPNCVPGTIVQVLDLSGNPVVSGPPDANGLFDTGCKLKCPTSYVVRVSNPNCTFTPSSKIVQVSCCPAISTVKFDCNCPPPRGRIIASVSGNCPPGTTIEIFDNGTLVASGQVDAQGIFDTGCTLPCGKTYTVEAKNPRCSVAPTPQQVFVPCCPEAATVQFACDCPPPPPPAQGRITVHLPAQCTSGTVVSILDLNGQVVCSGSPTVVQLPTGAVVGEYDTSCTLVCGQNYIVTATNPNCTIFPVGGVQATAGCCPDTTVVNLDCDCPPPPPPDHGRIVVTVNGPCGVGATVNITDPTGNPVMSGTTDNQGVYDTGCQLNCPATYVVTVLAQGAVLGTQQVTVGCCPDVTQVTIDCPPPPPAQGRITVHLPAQCTSGTVVSILDLNGQVVCSGPPSVVQLPTGAVVGEYDTSCTLVCGQNYIVTATNPNCTITPANGVQATAGCCPGTTVVNLDCNCPPPPDHGRIVVTVNGSCGVGATVNISDPTGNPVMSGTTDNQGVYDTGCQLNCPATYVVTVLAQGAVLGTQQVTVGCCPDVTQVTIDCAPPTSNCFQPPAGMVAWYPLDEPQNTLSFQDIAGSVQNMGLWGGTVGPQPVSGKVNGAQYFWGSVATYIDVPPHPELDFGTGSFSIDAWVNLVGCSLNHIYPIVEKYDPTTGVGYSFFIVGDKLRLVINGAAFSSNTLGASYNTWYHVAVTVDRPAGGPSVGTFWLNGAPVGTFVPPTTSVDNAAPVWIGRNYLVDTQQMPHCEIAIDELELFNVALSQNDIAGIYGADSAGKCKPALGRLTVSISPGFPNVVWDLFDANNHLVYKGNSNILDTGCTLFCNGTYQLRGLDLSTGTLLGPKQVTVPCCPQVGTATLP